jgi:hypothetical protein
MLGVMVACEEICGAVGISEVGAMGELGAIGFSIGSLGAGAAPSSGGTT